MKFLLIEMNTSLSSSSNISTARSTSKPDFIYYAIAGYQIAIFILSVPANSIVIGLFIRRYKENASILNLMVISLSLSHLLQSALAYPLNVIAGFENHWSMGTSLCYFEAFWVLWMAVASVNHFVIISIERYIIFRKLALYQRWRPLWFKIMLLTICWFTSLVQCIPPFFGWSSYHLEGVRVGCSLDWRSRETKGLVYIGAIFIRSYILPLVIIAFTNFSSLSKIKAYNRSIRSNVRVHQPQFVQDQQDRRFLRRERKIFHIVLTMISSFIFAWTPYTVVVFVTYINPELTSPLLLSIPSFFAKFSTVCDPMIVLAKQKEFRKLVRRFARGQ